MLSSNELDIFQHLQYPSLQQNAANFKLNYSIAHHLELM